MLLTTRTSFNPTDFLMKQSFIKHQSLELLSCSDAVNLTNTSLPELMPETSMVLDPKEEAWNGSQGQAPTHFSRFRNSFSTVYVMPFDYIVYVPPINL